MVSTTALFWCAGGKVQQRYNDDSECHSPGNGPGAEALYHPVTSVGQTACHRCWLVCLEMLLPFVARFWVLAWPRRGRGVESLKMFLLSCFLSWGRTVETWAVLVVLAFNERFCGVSVLRMGESPPTIQSLRASVFPVHREEPRPRIFLLLTCWGWVIVFSRSCWFPQGVSEHADTSDVSSHHPIACLEASHFSGRIQHCSRSNFLVHKWLSRGGRFKLDRHHHHHYKVEKIWFNPLGLPVWL